MTDDIVARLRGFHPCCGLHCDGYGKDETVPDCIAAADEIERLRKALTYEENRFNRQGTHGPGCWQWGPSHYECAMGEVERLRKALRNLVRLYDTDDGCRSLPEYIEARAALAQEPRHD